MEQKTPTPPPPPPQIKDEAARRAKPRHFPIFDLGGGGGGGGQGFPFILSKIVGLNCQTAKNTIPIYRLFEVARKTKSFVQELCSYFPKR